LTTPAPPADRGFPSVRLEALAEAVRLHARHQSDAEEVLETAGMFAAWLSALPHRLRLRPAPFTFPQAPSGGPGIPVTFTSTGGHMSVIISDAQEITYTVEPEDSKGFPVADTLTWSEDSSGAVVTVTPSADGLSALFAAVGPGTATITVSDGTLSGSDLITVTAGEVASLALTPGAPASE
jgi:hypothetical protein